ncbi:Arginyl-tRNA--protein transferase 1 [Mortierella alpina]|nr:Arginyl-tRNA--protein transferase 1 [Mortierella alpina]
MSENYSIIKPVGFTIASCGYCGKEDSAHVYGALAFKLTCQDYQDLLERGWRRFGLYLYKPNLRDRLNTSHFVPSKHQRKTVSRVNRYMKKQYVPLKISRESIAREDTAALEEHSPSPEPAHSTTSGTRRKSISPPLGKADTHHADFVQNIHAADLDKMEPGSNWRQFKVVLEPATFTAEKYDLYCEYQRGIHQVPSAMLSRESFDGSVTRSPLFTEALALNDPKCSGFVGYGTYHQCYYVDNKLVAVAVLDILPRCVSSNYFFYDPSLSSLSLGKYSTLREIALVQEIKAIPGCEAMEYYTMGHYVPSAPKTHYKAAYHPSLLLDPETNGWKPFDECINILDANRYIPFRDCELYNPRVKGLLITIEAERKARIKSKDPHHSDITTTSTTGCTMDVDLNLDSDDVESLGVREHFNEGMSSNSSGDEDGHKRKRSADSSTEAMRSGKRPSLTPPPPSCLPPPGMMNPDDVTEQDLSQLVVFQGDRAMMLSDSESFKNDKGASKAMREYYSAVGPALAPRMLVFAQ